MSTKTLRTILGLCAVAAPLALIGCDDKAKTTTPASGTTATGTTGTGTGTTGTGAATR